MARKQIITCDRCFQEGEVHEATIEVDLSNFSIARLRRTLDLCSDCVANLEARVASWLQPVER